MNGHELLAGRYELRGVLGRGGMAEVHDGWDTRLDRAVAIKLLYPALNADSDVRRRFEDEARAAAALNHPNIVSVHDYGEHHGTPFIVMERLPGRTLADEIAAGPMPPRRVRSILADVLGALARAHAAGVLHRDIKPGNVLVAPVTNAMKLADFGIAKTAGAAHTATGQIFGTMAYMSPERVAGAPASASDDMYAVGVMGYEALTGRRPYPQENPAVLVRALLDSPPPPIAAVMPDLDPALAAVIDRAMARDVSLRFENADHMRAVLDGTVPVGPPLSTHAGFVAPGQRPATKVMPHPPVAATNYFVPPPVPRKPMSRRRKLMVAGAALVALIVVALALALDPSSSQQPMQPISSSTPMPPPPPPPTSSPAPTPPVTPQVPGPGGKKGNGNGHGGHGGKRGD